MHEAGRVVAVVPAGDTGEAIVADLAAAGIHAELVQPRPGTYTLEDESFREHTHGVEQGLFVGLGIGALAGLVILLAVGALRDLSWTTQAILVAGIALQGTIPAIMWRMGRTDRYDDDPEVLERLTTDELVVVIQAVHDEDHARRVLERHGAAILADDEPRESAR